MENENFRIAKNSENNIKEYFLRLGIYCVKGAIFGGVFSIIFFRNLKKGALLGLGAGAGYCHEDLLKLKDCLRLFKNNTILVDSVNSNQNKL